MSTSTSTWQEEIKALGSHQSELICDALPTLQTSTEVIHSINKEAINDSTLYNGKKNNAPKHYLHYLLFVGKKFQLVNILYRWISGSTEIHEQGSLSDVFLQTPKPDLANIQDGFNFSQMRDQFHGITQIEFAASGS